MRNNVPGGCGCCSKCLITNLPWVDDGNGLPEGWTIVRGGATVNDGSGGPMRPAGTLTLDPDTLIYWDLDPGLTIPVHSGGSTWTAQVDLPFQVQRFRVGRTTDLVGVFGVLTGDQVGPFTEIDGMELRFGQTIRSEREIPGGTPPLNTVIEPSTVIYRKRGITQVDNSKLAFVHYFDGLAGGNAFGGRYGIDLSQPGDDVFATERLSGRAIDGPLATNSSLFPVANQLLYDEQGIYHNSTAIPHNRVTLETFTGAQETIGPVGIYRSDPVECYPSIFWGSGFRESTENWVRNLFFEFTGSGSHTVPASQNFEALNFGPVTSPNARPQTLDLGFNLPLGGFFGGLNGTSMQFWSWSDGESGYQIAEVRANAGTNLGTDYYLFRRPFTGELNEATPSTFTLPQVPHPLSSAVVPPTGTFSVSW